MFVVMATLKEKEKYKPKANILQHSFYFDLFYVNIYKDYYHRIWC